MEVKAGKIRQVYQSFIEKAEPEFIVFFTERTKRANSFISAYSRHYDKVAGQGEPRHSLEELVKLHIAFKKKVIEELSLMQRSLTEGDLSGSFEGFLNQVNNIVSQLEETILLEETFSNYTLKKSDDLLLLFRKVLVNMKMDLRVSALKVLNFFRRMLKKPLLSLVSQRKRRVPFAGMAQHYMLNEFTRCALEHVKEIYRSESANMLKLWQFDEGSDMDFRQVLMGEGVGFADNPVKNVDAASFFSQLKKDNEALLEVISAGIRKCSDTVFEVYDKSYEIADTAELPASFFSLRRIDSQFDKINAVYAGRIARWKNTHFTLLDDWAVDAEVNCLYYCVYDRFNLLKSRVDAFIAQNLEQSFSEIRDFINNSVMRIKEVPDAVKKASEIISAEREKVNNLLVDRILAQSIEKLTNCFADDFDAFTGSIPGLVTAVSDKRGFIKSTDYARGVRDSEIDYISPRELLSFEALPNFALKVQSLKENTENKLENVRLTFLSLGTVCDFNLETALMLMDKEKRSGKGAKEIAIQGYDRALVHLDKAKGIIDEVQQGLVEDLRRAVNIFYSDIQKLKNTENVLELNMKVMRIRALERSKRIRNNAIAYIRGLIPVARELLLKTRQALTEFTLRAKLWMGFAVEKKKVSFELSEFIIETQQSLRKLPFVYQRLYQLQPTDEERFFVNREKEQHLLQNSFNNWQKERYIITAVIGEKGSGVTSLINYFLRNIKGDKQIIKHTLAEKIHTPEKYYRLFNTLLETDSITSNDQLIEKLNSTPGTRIIALENLQHMFLKKVHGFECMKLLFELMSNTSKKIMWIGAYTPYSWDYLEKSIFISNYFTDEIHLEKLGDETIKEIVFKRNRLSGYQINFIADEENLQTKTYRKLNEAGRQKYLQKQFFLNLNRLANGNISLAQMYWLRSTKDVDEKSISIATLDGLDFSFVKDLSGNSLFALQVLILHDGLNLEDFSAVMNQPESVSRNLLIPMLEKGLLIRPRQKFNINPMIYKYVAFYLSSKNFIH